MTIQKYSAREALDRIYRLFRGDTLADTPEVLTPPIYSEDESLSRLAELLNGSLPGESAVLPSAVSITYLEHEYGEIYTSTGTVTMVVGTSATKITGSFHVNGLSTSNITPDFNDDRIVINSVGSYFVALQLSFSGTAAATFTVQGYLDSVAQPQIKTIRKLNAAGDVGSISAVGRINVTGTNTALELYVNADGSSKNFLIQAGQVTVSKDPTSA